ncbi:amylopullulanase [Metabacillus sp. GX 13764]|uniref:pullulanase X25 domain-containing protein n=1 Tax=Metabacillus kandeliae TaxID=2900151 RepID=UPI001E37ADBA|nr:alpha-amylase family glycosyl hydrolase [Metabacillus kandeliae]MCD7036679.1 amylopullulanase [Metabacillus kandeliae]
MTQLFAGVHPGMAKAETAERTVTLVGSLQDELGASGEWDPASDKTRMTVKGNGIYTLTGTLPAGTYEYKAAINGSWDENYGAGGAKGGDNIKLTLSEKTEVTFYYSDITHAIADSTVYKALPEEKTPRLAGDIQPAIGAGAAWSPDQSTALFADQKFDGIYTYTKEVPKGKYEYKVVLGSQWGEEYPADNAKLNVLKDTVITFSYNSKTKEVTTDYSPSGSDGQVAAAALYHDTWDPAYRNPFGAVPVGKKVTLRFSAKKDDLTRASLYVKNYQTGTTKVIKMTKEGSAETKDKGSIDFWEASFTPDAKGVHGYKFIAGDQDALYEYGEDTQEGHTGKAADKNAGLFQLTVYDPAYKTPDWMKEAVVYQIFPDRFNNGNTKNDHSKDQAGARGKQPIEHPASWSTLPDNPRENTDSSYKGDNEWSNDFFGGDLAGIKAKLDYLQSLGVNTLYLNPIALAPSNHKYDATDYKALDPMFGSPEEFKAFTNELAKRNMHLILDGVFNHVSDDSIYFDRYNKYNTVGAYEYWSRVYDLMNTKKLSEKDAKAEAEKQFNKEGQIFSPYGFQNWFNIENEIVDKGLPTERYKYQAWWGYDSLPEFKSVDGKAVDHPSELNNQAFADYMMYEKDSVSKTWIDRGSSGWRLDVANEVDPSFWQEFRKQMKSKAMTGAGATLKQGEQPLILGEIWDDASKYFLGDQYDSVMNYRFRGAVLDFLKNGNAQNAEQSLMAIQEDYPKEAFQALMNLMGSHDTARAVFLLGNGTDSYERAEKDPNYNYELGLKRLSLAALFQMGYAGAPTIYYGDEAGLTGSKDPDDRRTFPWGKENKELTAKYQKIGKVRKENSDLFSYGELNHVYADGDAMAYTRTKDGKAALVVINRGTKEQTVKIPVKNGILNGVKLTDQLDSAYSVTVSNGIAEVKIPAQTGRMLLSSGKMKAPKSVKALFAHAGLKMAALTWKGNAPSYNVYVSSIKGGMYEKVQETAKEGIKLDGLTNGKKYYYAVTAVDSKGNESKMAETGAIIPHYDLKQAVLSGLTKLPESELDLSKQLDVSAELSIKGVTDKEIAEGVQGNLQVRKSGEKSWTAYEALDVERVQAVNVFKASFTPYEAGTYEYRFAFTSDLGTSWVYTPSSKVNVVPNKSDVKKPADEAVLAVPQAESGQVNLSWSLKGADDPYVILIFRNGEKIADVSGTADSYRDFQVDNGTAYEYSIKVLDRAGNFVDSNKVSVTPDVVMVQVTFKVHAPDYTPLNASVTIPNSLNGWNTGAWEMSRNGAVSPDWEYTIDAQEGTELTYKYVKGNSWDQEGLPDHTPGDKTDDDVSLYGFGATGTDMKVIVQNQGNNKMTVQDEIFRWIDMPVAVSSIQSSGSQLTVKGTAIKDGVLTINGEAVQIGKDMSFQHTITLAAGQKNVSVHIEPSEAAKASIYKNDGGAIAKNTKDYTIDASAGTIREGK